MSHEDHARHLTRHFTIVQQKRWLGIHHIRAQNSSLKLTQLYMAGTGPKASNSEAWRGYLIGFYTKCMKGVAHWLLCVPNDRFITFAQTHLLLLHIPSSFPSWKGVFSPKFFFPAHSFSPQSWMILLVEVPVELYEHKSIEINDTVVRTDNMIPFLHRGLQKCHYTGVFLVANFGGVAPSDSVQSSWAEDWYVSADSLWGHSSSKQS